MQLEAEKEPRYCEEDTESEFQADSGAGKLKLRGWRNGGGEGACGSLRGKEVSNVISSSET